MAKLWITYARVDNEAGDIDFIAQELAAAGLEIKLDRWSIDAGKRLWEQIEKFICSDSESDAWLLIATQNSLASQPCKEEFAYALDRALRSRGQEFPVIALFISDVDSSLIPAGIRTRLFVSVTDPDWKERVVAAAEGRHIEANRPSVDPYHLQVHDNQAGDRPFAIEVRPRAGVWAPFIAAIPIKEKDEVDPSIMIGASGVPTGTGMLTGRGNDGPTDDNKFWMLIAGNQATPTQSYYVWCKTMPSQLIFGVSGGPPQFNVQFDQ